MSRRWRTLLLSFASLSLLISLAFAFSFSPFVRSKAQSSADRLGAQISIQKVRPALLGAKLLDVHLTFADIPALSVQLDQVFISTSGQVTISGGSIELLGDRETVLSQFAKWRASRPHSGTPTQNPRSRLVAVRGVRLSWTDPAGKDTLLTASGLEAQDLFSGDLIRLQSLQAKAPLGEMSATALEIAWDSHQGALLRSLKAGTVQAVARIPAPLPESESAKPTASASANVPSADRPPKTARTLPKTPPRATEPRPQDATPPPSKLLSIRDRLSNYASIAAGRMTPDAQLKVAAFEVRLERGKDAVTLGPGNLAVERKGQDLVVDLAPGASAGAPGISFHAIVPLGAGPILLDVNGGPVTLAALGLREGDLGLRHPEQASLSASTHLELHADGLGLSFNGTLKATGVSLFHSKLAEGPVEGLSVAARLRGEGKLDGSRLVLEDSEIDVGSLRFALSGVFGFDSQTLVNADCRFGIPLVPCQEALDSLPATLIPVVHGMQLAGTLSLSGHLRFDPQRPKDFLFDYRANNDCRFLSVPQQVDVQRFRQPFKHTVYGPENRKVEIDSGPGTPGWIPLGGISQHMEMAVMTTEDGRFRIHHGFDHEAIHNSVRENLFKGSFVRGASTLSMQLAKNLYLERRKTVSRKLQELILTMYLEQVLTKDQILELYLNVVEFGPMVYGIGPASAHYFRCSPTQLTPGQALFLSSILPQPRAPRFAAGGKLHEGWMKYIWKLIRIAEKRGWLTSEDADAAVSEWVVQGGPPLRTEEAPGRVGPGGEEIARPPEDD